MRRICLALVPLLMLPACRRPEVEAFGQRPLPIVVDFQLSPANPRYDTFRREYAAALRARLATVAQVVPEDQAAPAPAAVLHVTVTRVQAYGEPSPAVVGTATGVAVGTLSAMAGNRGAFFDGLFWGLWTGAATANTLTGDAARLGYAPSRVSALVTLDEPGVQDPLAEFNVGGGEVVKRMAPLPPDQRRDESRVREEEAKAFAEVVVSRLQETFHWLPLGQPSYYHPPVSGEGN